jgi:hypothetical protein
MTTAPTKMVLPRWNRVPNRDLENLLAGLDADSSLMESARMRERLDALDELDTRLGVFHAEELVSDAKARIHHPAKAIQTRMESANADVYKSIRSEIVRGAPPQALLHWIQASVRRDEAASPSAGFSYDNRDEVVSGILQLREPGDPRPHPHPEMVFYQPTPVRHILHLINASALSKDDVFVDLGSGLGHVVLLVSILAGVRSVGIEVEAAYVASAQECAQSLHLRGVRFIHEDATSADLSSGNVFYLYSPFTGSILASVLDRLRRESRSKPIKICTLGPCACTVAHESWLRSTALPDPGRITVFQSDL